MGVVTAVYPQFPQDYEYPACNLCGYAHGRELIPQAKQTHCTLVECLNCGFRYFSPRPTWESMRDYFMRGPEAEAEARNCYRWGSFFENANPEQEKASIRNYYNMMLALVCKANGGVMPKSMYEIGCGVGWFALAARELGITEIRGIDINPFAVQVCNEKQGLLGITNGDFFDEPVTWNYDLVVAMDVLEHVYHAKETLDKISRLLWPGGLFLFKTFCDEKDIQREMLSPPTHAVHWTESILRREIERAGMNIVSWTWDYGGYMVIGIARKA